MGQSLTYEIGKLNVGRRVKIKRADGSKNDACGKIVAACARYAEVQIDNHPTAVPIRAEWERIRDWTAQNSGPLKMPERPTLAAKIIPAVPPPPAIAPRVETAPDAFAVFGELSSQIPEAVTAIGNAEDEVDAAMEMLQSAQARHAEAVNRLSELRKQVATATALIDRHLVGTSKA